MPDLEGSAVQVLRDWNSGKIAYHTVPPAFHPSSLARPVPKNAPAAAAAAAAPEVAMMDDDGKEVPGTKGYKCVSRALRALAVYST